jgi:4-hydroxy-tetrahydrodipicolinate reductase
MGAAIAGYAALWEGCEVVAGIDPGEGSCSFPVFAEPCAPVPKADVIVDFSHPSALEPLLAYALSNKLPVVMATTGLAAGQIAAVQKAAEEIPVFLSANMSLGINLLRELIKESVRVLGPLFDIEIVERHHNLKLDAPSGTALMLADSAAAAMGGRPLYRYDRHPLREKRSGNEIGLHSVRGGSIAGDHDVIFAGPNEVITLSHHAQTREVFAAGALRAALFLSDQAPGLYDMSDLIASGLTDQK